MLLSEFSTAHADVADSYWPNIYPDIHIHSPTTVYILQGSCKLRTMCSIILDDYWMLIFFGLSCSTIGGVIQDLDI